MGFKDLFHKKNTNSDCCSVELVADDDTDTTETTTDQEEQHPQATSYPDTSRSLPAWLAPGRGADRDVGVEPANRIAPPEAVDRGRVIGQSPGRPDGDPSGAPGAVRGAAHRVADGLTHHRREGDDHTRDQQRLRGDHYWRWPGGAGPRLLPAASRRGHPGPRRSGGCRWGVAACVAINDVVFHRGVFQPAGQAYASLRGVPTVGPCHRLPCRL